MVIIRRLTLLIFFTSISAWADVYPTVHPEVWDRQPEKAYPALVIHAVDRGHPIAEAHTMEIFIECAQGQDRHRIAPTQPEESIHICQYAMAEWKSPEVILHYGLARKVDGRTLKATDGEFACKKHPEYVCNAAGEYICDPVKENVDLRDFQANCPNREDAHRAAK